MSSQDNFQLVYLRVWKLLFHLLHLINAHKAPKAVELSLCYDTEQHTGGKAYPSGNSTEINSQNGIA